MLALVTASTASLEPVAGFSHGVMALGGLQPTTSTGGSGGGASAVEMVYLGVYSGTSAAARVSGLEHSSAAPTGTHGRHRWWLVAVVEAKTVLNWAIRVWERVEAASSAANMQLALAVAGVTRAAKTRQRGTALARRIEAAAAVFCVPPSPTTTTRLCAARRAPIALAHGPATTWRALVSPRRPSACAARPPWLLALARGHRLWRRRGSLC